MGYVFDTEPILAFGFDEKGGGDVEDKLKEVFDGKESGYISRINLVEVRYISIRKDSVAKADTFIHYLLQKGLDLVETKDVWRDAARIKTDYRIAVGDAFAVASAEEMDGTLIVGADDDFDPIISSGLVSTYRFRSSGV